MFSQDESTILQTIAITVSIFSIVGCIFIIFCYNYLKELKNFAFKLVMWMSVADVLKSISNVMGVPTDRAVCNFQGWMKVMFGWSSMLWTTIIAYTLHQAFIKSNSAYFPGVIHRKERTFHMVAWGVPFIVSLLPFTTSSYGPAGAWCWIASETTEDKVWRFAAYYGPFIVGVGYNIFVYYEVHKKLSEDPSGVNTIQKRLIYYPLVIFGCYLIGFVYRFVQLFFDHEILWLASLMVLTICSQGLVNAMVYGATPAVREKLCGNRSNQDQFQDDLDRDFSPELNDVEDSELSSQSGL